MIDFDEPRMIQSECLEVAANAEQQKEIDHMMDADWQVATDRERRPEVSSAGWQMASYLREVGEKGTGAGAAGVVF